MNSEEKIIPIPEITTLPEQNLVCYRRTGPYGAENRIIMENLKDWAEKQGLFTEKSIIYGIPRDNPEITPPEKCRYDVCLVIPSQVNLQLPQTEPPSEISVPPASFRNSKTAHTGGPEHSPPSAPFLAKFPGGKYALFTVEHTAGAIQRA